jgi:hypothetical protein
MVPITSVLVLPLAYAAWRRIQRHRRLASDPSQPLAAPILRAMSRSRLAYVIYIVCGAAALSIAAAKVSPVYWLPVAIVSLVAFVKRLGYQRQIRDGITSRL